MNKFRKMMLMPYRHSPIKTWVEALATCAAAALLTWATMAILDIREERDKAVAEWNQAKVSMDEIPDTGHVVSEFFKDRTIMAVLCSNTIKAGK